MLDKIFEELKKNFRYDVMMVEDEFAHNIHLIWGDNVKRRQMVVQDSNPNSKSETEIKKFEERLIKNCSKKLLELLLK